MENPKEDSKKKNYKFQKKRELQNFCFQIFMFQFFLFTIMSFQELVASPMVAFESPHF